MPEFTSYEEGVPCWVDASLDDVDEAKAFYTGLFGWSYLETPPEAMGYTLATVNGKQVAGIGPKQDPNMPSAWTTYIWVDDADGTAKRIADAGGTIMAEPFDVMDQGRMAIAADPTGAVFGLWQGYTHKGSQIADEPGSVTWNELATNDSAKARKFYSSVFGYTYEPIEGMDYTMLQIGGQTKGGIMGMTGEGWDGVPPHWATYFQVADTDVAVAKVRELGGEVKTEPFDSAYGRVALVEDCCGAMFFVITPPADQAAAAG